MREEDAIVCEVPSTHPASEKYTLEKLPVKDKMTFVDFYKGVDEVKNKGQMIWLLTEYMRKGERRGFLNADEYPEQMAKIREMAG